MRHTNSERDSLKAVYGVLREEAPDPFSRARLRRRVLERAEMPALPSWALLLRSWRIPLAAAAALLLAAGTVLFLQSGGGGGPEPEPELRIQANGGVHLQWTDVGKASYRVLRSDSPANFRQAKAVTVQGTAYVDREAGNSRVTYYLVE